MDEREAAATFAYGMEAIDGDVDLLAPGEMGIGNTTSAAAIYAALYGGPASRWTGRGTGLDDDGLARKNAAIDAALALHASVSRRSFGNSAPARRTGNRRDDGLDRRGEAQPHSRRA